MDYKDLVRFLSKFDAASHSCWIWTGTIYKRGYGYFGLKGKMKSAHRLSYQLFRGDIPAGIEIDHICHSNSACEAKSQCLHRRCVNPWHMELVTHLENIQRGKGVGSVIAQKEREKTHCPHGHEYSIENTWRDKEGHRHCKACFKRRGEARKAA